MYCTCVSHCLKHLFKGFQRTIIKWEDLGLHVFLSFEIFRKEPFMAGLAEVCMIQDYRVGTKLNDVYITLEEIQAESLVFCNDFFQ